MLRAGGDATFINVFQQQATEIIIAPAYYNS
jgi:hypothetical protein